MDFVKKYAYIFLGVVCVLALGGLFLLTRNQPTGVVDAGKSLIPGTEVHAQEPGLERGLDTTISEPDPTPEPEPEPIIEPEPTLEPEHLEPTMVTVHIVGAVRYPGVYEVPYGSRLNYVLQKAGGYSEDADQGQINLSAFVQDAMQIRIPAIGEEAQEPIVAGHPEGQVQQAQPGQQAQPASEISNLVNINLANLTELQTLQGIGPVIAQNIIDHREVHGGFNNIEELLNVNRIGPSTFESIRNRVTVD